MGSHNPYAPGLHPPGISRRAAFAKTTLVPVDGRMVEADLVEPCMMCGRRGLRASMQSVVDRDPEDRTEDAAVTRYACASHSLSGWYED